MLERPATPVLRLRRLHAPDEFGRQRMIDVLTLDFDYGGVRVDGADEAQFIRVKSGGQIAFIRRDVAAEAAALDTLRPDGFVQMRVADGKSARGQRVHGLPGPGSRRQMAPFRRRAHARTQRRSAGRAISTPISARNSPRMSAISTSQVEDADEGSFSLEFGIEIDGVRHPLLPILEHLLARGGIEAAQIVEGEIITSMDDGRVIKLPAERISACWR